MVALFLWSGGREARLRTANPATRVQIPFPPHIYICGSFRKTLSILSENRVRLLSLIAAEVRSATCNFKSCMGLLLYKIDTNFHHGEGPIVAEKLLLYTGENLVVGKHRFTVEDFDNNGLLVKVEKML